MCLIAAMVIIFLLILDLSPCGVFDLLKWTYQHIKFGLINTDIWTYRRLYIETYQYLFLRLSPHNIYALCPFDTWR